MDGGLWGGADHQGGGQYEVMGRVLYPDLMVVIVIQPSAYAKTQNCTLKKFSLCVGH